MATRFILDTDTFSYAVSGRFLSYLSFLSDF